MSDHCTCVPPSGSQRGWTLDPASDLWVCSICRKPSKATLALSDPRDRIMA
jgi:hypothetical protein